MAEHTPGPWLASSFGLQVLTGDSWNTICVLHEGQGEKWKDHRQAGWEDGRSAGSPNANALLIAAAPDLLDALLSVVYVFGMNNAEPLELRRAMSKQMDKAVAAIRKAEGRPLPAEASDGIAAARPLGIGQREMDHG
ncbi:hypothetical protein [Antarcticirhabdus aurantiaca]|uniref:hypothetical protein n=1 Tax=Antarcticirhabdus aurantiaca TaxID=2606717 RepID=UPI00131ADE43|nr:hypothetical protein [Antarcticirhabdus aurantiaca]